MDSCSSGNRKRKACYSTVVNHRTCSSAKGLASVNIIEAFPAMSASPKKLALDSRSSDVSSQSQLICSEGFDRMTLESATARSPFADMTSSGSPSSFLSVTTAGTSKTQVSDEGVLTITFNS